MKLTTLDVPGSIASDETLDADIWTNVQCYMLACKYAVAVFTRYEERVGNTIQLRTDVHNPNVAIELGYMLSRGKRVLILKDSELPSLPTDIVGALYQSFEFDSPHRSVTRIVTKWLAEQH